MKKTLKQSHIYASALALIAFFFLTAVISASIGRVVDDRLGTYPVGTLIILAVSYGLSLIIGIALRKKIISKIKSFNGK